MKTYFKRFLAVFLSLFLIIAPTIQQANAASAWSITSAASAGARAVVTATKSGYKSAVNVAPTAGRLALTLGRTASTASLLYAAAQIALDGVDFVLDPNNNSVKYKVPTADYYVNTRTDTRYLSIAAAGAAACAALTSDTYVYTSYSYIKSGNYWLANCRRSSDGYVTKEVVNAFDLPPQEKVLTVNDLAPRVLSNAARGHAASQAAVLESAIEMVIGGQFDQDLLAGAVPTNDSTPLVPSVPISGNGNAGYGGVGANDGADDSMSGATPGAQADSAIQAAESAKRAAQAASDAAKSAAEQSARDADAAQDLINSASDQAAIDAANARAAAAEAAASSSQAVADAARQAASDAAVTADRAAAAAAQAAKSAAAQAASDLAAAVAAGDAAAIAAAQSAKAAADAAVAAANDRAAAAEKAAEKAKAESTKPFELPAFCSWASIVCETAEWLKREPETPEITAIDTDSPIDDFDSDKSYITFTGSCPPKYTASLGIMGVTAPFEFDYTPICTVMSYLKPFIVGAGYIAAAYIIAGHSRGSKD